MNRIQEIEEMMKDANFWDNPETAKQYISELKELRNVEDPYKDSQAIISFVAGTGGDDAEDFTRMLYEMYQRFSEKQGWSWSPISVNTNEQNGLKTAAVEISAKGAYKKLQGESGVHRLVRISPFNSGGKRQTSFALVDVLPKLPQVSQVQIPEKEIRIDISRASGPGGQNVNKRDTAVRITHIPTGISIRVESERSQQINKEKALLFVQAKLQQLKDKERDETITSLSADKKMQIEWGNQIRSYVLHPYKLVKDHRSSYEEKNPEKVFEGNIEGFLESFGDSV